jgi:SlyX protein
LNDSVKRLEEKIAYLERHVVEQDKAMLGLAEELTRLRREWQSLRAALTRGTQDGGDAIPSEARPPHY